jgi:hypothetical protein
LILLLSPSQVSLAQEAVLSETLQLSISQLRYQPKAAPEQWLWAHLDYVPMPNGQMLFAVKNYGQVVPANTPVLMPLASISDQGPPKISFLNSHAAELTFKASTPLACAVVYGTSRQFGALATDPSMDGATLTEHHPVMSGLNADTDYFYRVQGSAANGTLYWSNIGSFHTPASSATPSMNVAALANGAFVSKVSSNFGGVSNDKTWGANSAIDASSATAWSSNGDGNQAFIEITLAKAATIKTVEVWSRAMNDGSAKIRRFTVTVDSGQVFGPFTLVDTDKAYSFAVNALTKTLRFTVVDSAGGNTGFIELAAY